MDFPYTQTLINERITWLRKRIEYAKIKKDDTILKYSQDKLTELEMALQKLVTE